MKSRIRGNRRRGVLILIVLSMLVMFGLMLITFVIITGQAKRTSLVHRRSEQYFDPPDRMTHEAAMVLLRGSNNLACPTWLHSLLEDIYGDESLSGQVEIFDRFSSQSLPYPEVRATKPSLLAGGQLVEFTVQRNVNVGQLPGRVITFLSGSAAGVSTRIVGYRQAALPGGTLLFWDLPAKTQRVWKLVVTAEGMLPKGPDGKPGVAGFDDDNDNVVDNPEELAFPFQNPAWSRQQQLRGRSDDLGYLDRFVINGPAFSGTGVGYNATSGRLDWVVSPGVSAALLLRPFLSLPEYAAALTAAGGKVLANPDYTAADHQHPFLAVQLPNGQVPVPSFHRPELVNYWMNQASANWATNYDLQRRVILRPLQQPDHPNFTGSNPSFNPLTGPWDVDTDGDGIPDAIWVDFGFPVRSMPDGRLVKPLVASLIVDLDGRLNLNAHGTYAQTDPRYYGAVNPLDPPPPDPTNYFRSWPASFIFSQFPMGGGPPLPRGFGYGPAETNLLPLFGDYFRVGITPQEQSNMLAACRALLGMRYSPSGFPGSSGIQDDPLHINKWWEYYPGNYWNWAGLAGAYGSPPNRLGDGAIGLDPGGRPLYARMGRAVPDPNPALANDERMNDPYKLNLSKRTPFNTPYTPAELERLLRFYDLDAARLPSRLLPPPVDPAVDPVGARFRDAMVQHRHEITTESWHVPAPTFFIPRHLLEGNRGILGDLAPGVPAEVRQWLVSLLPGRSVQDLLAARIYVEQRRTGAPPQIAYWNYESLPASAAPSLLPLELTMRVKMDVNRPFGNAHDENSNGVVDDLLELNELFYQVNSAGQLVTSPFSNVNENAVPAGVSPGYWARQLYARHLYVLMMMVVDLEKIPTPGISVPDLQYRDRARQVAQWAINVVDFRDRDSIMTPFEYDIYPFKDDVTPFSPQKPWNVDGIIDTPTSPSPDDTETYRGLVWGCERPELLITETLALHDRRVENLDKPPGPDPGKWYPIPQGEPPPKDWDKDFDQRKVPMASLFVELYNPCTPLEPQPAELCSGPSGGVQLNRVAKDAATGKSSPVWRMVIVPGASVVDPDPVGGGETPSIRRSIYFTDITNPSIQLPAAAPSEVRFYWKAAAGVGGITPIAPGGYAVIGPGDVGSQFTTCIGRVNGSNPLPEPTDGLFLNQTRRIQLKDPGGADPNTTPVKRNLAAGLEPVVGQVRQPIAAVPINEPRRLNISDPPGGYPAPDDLANLAYTSPIDRPFDYDDMGRDALMPGMGTAVKTQGTTLNIAKVHLQRLADPTRPYDSVANPYRTIDSTPIDLTAFNGWDETTPGDGDVIPDGSEGEGAIRGEVMFASRQRGEVEPGQTPDNILWAQTPLTKNLRRDTRESGNPVNYFPYRLRHTLGYLNNFNAWDFNTPATITNLRANMLTSGPNLGDPGDVAFPWLNWNNRPFVSELELLMVPVAKSSMLLKPYNPIPGPEMNLTGFGLVDGNSNPYRGTGQTFPHLLNFFWSEPDTSVNPPATRPNFFRILDLVGVPSPFVGTEIQGNPSVFGIPNGGHTFYPPFNRIPNYREPGRLNLNTVTSANVWQGSMNYYPGLGTTGFNDFTSTRQGPGGPMDANFPTRFANPLRSYAGQMLATAPTPYLTQAEVNATLLRSVPAGGQPLFAMDPAVASDCNNTARNPFFRYQGLQRLGNLVTTRSNVFAVWITVGYFQVQPWGAIDAAHPDGYQLGSEVGADSGEIKRHRAFYIFDRSIPVGFQRGLDLNADKTIVLKRYIE